MFTDLDGTLLDHKSYSFRGAVCALDLLRRRQVPVVPVSSKTAPEIELWMRQLGLAGPYIYENGGGIMIPRDFFPDRPRSVVEDGGSWRLDVGDDIISVREELLELSRRSGFQYRGFGEMTVEEVARLTGLKGGEVEMCLNRRHDEPFIINGPYDWDVITTEAAGMGLMVTRGDRFFHAARGCDKGMAVDILAGLARQAWGNMATVGIGDSLNDLPLLEAVDTAYLVQKPGGGYDPQIPQSAARRVAGIGPYGWRRAIEEVMLHVR